jgi:hypothetical protein
MQAIKQNSEKWLKRVLMNGGLEKFLQIIVSMIKHELQEGFLNRKSAFSYFCIHSFLCRVHVFLKSLRNFLICTYC